MHIGGSKSFFRPIIVASVRQGAQLTPLLYTLFVSDMEFPEDIKVSLYADDTAFFTAAKKTKKNNETTFTYAQSFYSKWKTKVNDESCHNFPNKMRRKPTSALNLGTSNIDFSPEVTYLGVKFDVKLINVEIFNACSVNTLPIFNL